MSSGNYPMGAENDPRAPYNEVDHREDIDVTATTVMVWSGKISALNAFYDEFGALDTSGCELEEDFIESHYTIHELLGLLRKYVENDMDVRYMVKDNFNLSQVLKDIDAWKVDDFYVED